MIMIPRDLRNFEISRSLRLVAMSEAKVTGSVSLSVLSAGVNTNTINSKLHLRRRVPL